MTRARWGGVAVGAIVVLVFLGSVYFAGRGGPCEEAEQARNIAFTSPNPEDRSAALTLYYLKKAECEASGGTVGT